jgi:2-iminobutanoate/2-iminopropanoate deaminase
MKRAIVTEKAPKAIGSYSQAVHCARFIVTSGQLGIDPSTGTLVSGGVAEEVRQVLANLAEVLKEARSDFSQVVKTNIYLADMADFPVVDAAYKACFAEDAVLPARTTVQVAGLPKGAQVEIDMMAYLEA